MWCLGGEEEEDEEEVEEDGETAASAQWLHSLQTLKRSCLPLPASLWLMHNKVLRLC